MAAHSSADRTGATILAVARGWIGTPYHHGASLRGVGCDCLGLVRGVWREVLGAEPEALPAYTGDWGDVTGDETLLNAASRHLESIPPTEARTGDILIFRIRPGRVAKHCGLLAAPLAAPAGFLHAWEATPVAEVPLTRWWRQRVAASFRFPGLG